MGAFEIYSAALVKAGLAVISVTVNGVEYLAEAPRFTDATAKAWRCSAIFPIGETGHRIKHCDGLQIPGENGENLAGLTYV